MQRRYLQARYRTQQLLHALRERPDSRTRRLAESYLEQRGRALFYRLSPRDQQHSARTAALLLRSSACDQELIAAALLHDVGKGRQQIWQRVLYVVLAAGWPGLLRRLARPGAGWRGALERAMHHAAAGARLARAAGYSERVVRLVAAHHEHGANGEVAALQAADRRA